MTAIQLKAAILIIGIAAGRKRLSRYFSPSLLEWLWILPAVRLLLPQQIGIPMINIPQPGNLVIPLSGRHMWVRWIGFGILFLLMLINCIRFYSGMQKKAALQNETVIRWIQAHPCRLHYRIYTSTFIASPMVYGLLFPKIVLPARSYSSAQYENILLHEWIHIRRGDLWKKAFMILTVMLNWYNPACWLMLVLFSRDIELACDADVLRMLQKEEHTIYAAVLLDCYTHMNPSAILETGFLNGILQERIGAIMKQRKMSYKAKCFAVVLFSMLFLTAFAKASDQTKAAVPNLIGKTLPEAEQILQESGYEFWYER